MAIRTDLAVESKAYVSSNEEGIIKKVEDIDGVSLIKIEIKTKKAAETVGKSVGNYITIQQKDMIEPDKWETVKLVLIDELKKFFEGKNSVMVVGLGNKNITPDNIGPEVANKVLATRHIFKKLKKILKADNLRSVSVIVPGVIGQTGIESSEIVEVMAKRVKPDLVIIIDALAARAFERLGRTIQLTDSGISPGSGVDNKRKELSKEIIGVPVLVIGVPTVVDMNDCEENEEKKEEASMMVTPKNIDSVVKAASNIISQSLNSALFPELSQEELKILVG